MKREQGSVKSLTALQPLAAMLTILMAGLCASLWTNTSAAQQRDTIVQNDIAVDPDGAVSSREPARDNAHDKPHIALLLPARKAALADAAAAVQAGFFAAVQADGHSNVSIFLYETSDDNQANLSLYRKAQAASQLVVGPLARNITSALAPAATVPTIVLSPMPADGTAALSPLLLSMGLSIEDEAHQLAQWAHASEAPGRAWIISTNASWQRRAAHAFQQEMRKKGRSVNLIEIGVADGALDPERLSQLREQAHGAAPALILLALDYQQAIQLREALGTEAPLYGTSQLNPFTAAQWKGAEPQPQLEGLRLLDIPCRLQQGRDVSVEAANPDFDRLQALGRDAYKIMLPILAGQQHFSIDGDTGQLEIDFGGPVRFSRKLTPARYENGRVVALPIAP